MSIYVALPNLARQTDQLGKITFPMATPISSISLSLVLFASLLLLLADVEGNEITKNSFHALQINSLPPSNLCNHSSKVVKGGSSLKVVHKHGPCNEDHKASTAPYLSETLRLDKLRVDSIHARRSLSSQHVVDSKDMKTRVRFDGESKTSASDYIVTVGFGTPKQEFPLIFDTGSGSIWTQCKPCNPCYPKPIPIFDPTKSTSFKQDSCSSPTCKFILPNGRNCSSSKLCKFGVVYADQSSTALYLATETLTIKPSNTVFKNVYFGCGYQMGVNDSNGESGILGLDRYRLSFPSQNAHKFQGHFSYCIPSSPSSTGHLTFGGKVSKTVKFSPISKSALGSEFYDIEMTGISIGGRKIFTNASLFKIPRVTIDSGTVITRFSNKTYSVLRSVFRGMMKDYPLFEVDDEAFDTCYDFSNYTTVTVPGITVFFKGGVEVNIDVSGIMIDFGSNLYCLGFGVYGDDDKSAIFGNVQQKTYTVVFDDANKRVGFGPAGCD